MNYAAQLNKYFVRKSVDTSYSSKELEVYDQYWDSVSREKTLLSGSYQDGKAVGKAEGKAEGLSEGIAQGIETIAINMLKASKPIDEISLFTGLSLDTIRQLKQVVLNLDNKRTV